MRDYSLQVIGVHIDENLIERAQRQLSQKAFDAAARQAAVRALNHMQNEIAEVTSRDYYLSKQRVKRELHSHFFNDRYGVHISLSASAKKILASSYEISPRKRPYSRMHGLYVGIMRKGGLKLIPNAFLLKDNLPMIRRKGSGKEWIYEGKYLYNTWKGLHYLYGPSIASIARNPDNLPDVMEKTKETFAKRFQHEVLYRLGVFKK